MDWFDDPIPGSRTATAPVQLFKQGGYAQQPVRVIVNFKNTFDAGVLSVRSSADSDAKLRFERLPSGEEIVVSVVTRGFSDGAPPFPIQSGCESRHCGLIKRDTGQAELLSTKMNQFCCIPVLSGRIRARVLPKWRG